MKMLMTIALLLIGSLSFAQQLNDKMKDAFKTNNPEMLLAEVNAQKASINDCFDIDGATYNLIAISIKMNRNDIFNALIAQKVDLNKICNDKTPLMYTAKYGQLDYAKALLKAGADVSIKNNEGKTAFDYAVKYEKLELQKLLAPTKK